MEVSSIDFNMNDVVSHGVFDDNVLHINWGVTIACNYNCSYCFGSGVHFESLQNPNYSTLEELKIFADQLIALNKDVYYLALSGGEPTIHPELLNFLRYFGSFNKKIVVYTTTNGSRSIKFFEEMLSINGINNLIAISVHLEYVKIEHIKEVIKCCNKYKVPIKLEFMFNPDRREQCNSIMDTLLEFRKTSSFYLTIAELREGDYHEKVDSRYTNEDFNWADVSKKKFDDIVAISSIKIDEFEDIYKGYYQLKGDNSSIELPHYLAMRTGKKNFDGFYCCGGINLIRVLHDGSYNAAICTEFQFIGNIFKDGRIDLIALTEPVKCTLKGCGCSANDVVPKFINKEDAIKYINQYRQKIMPFILNNFSSMIKEQKETIKCLENKIVNTEYTFELEKTNKKVDKLIDALSWWIPIKKWRNHFRSRFSSDKNG